MIALAIVVAGFLVAQAIILVAQAMKSKSKQEQIDEWYESLSPEEKSRYEMPAEVVFDETVAKGLHNDARKVKELKNQGKSIKEIAELLGMSEDSVENFLKSHI